MDISLAYREEGNGKPVVLLHGNGESSLYFRHQIPFLARSFRVLAPDTRGHGHSPRGNAPFTLEQFAQDLLAFLEERQLDRIILLGFSDGANIALLFALRYPGRVEKLILNGGNLFPAGVKIRYQLPIAAQFAAASVAALFSKKAVPKKEMLGLMVCQPHIRFRELHALKMPVLVVAGTKDMIRRRHTEKIAAHLPKAKLCIPEGDHFLAERSPEVFNRALQYFLE